MARLSQRLAELPLHTPAQQLRILINALAIAPWAVRLEQSRVMSAVPRLHAAAHPRLHPAVRLVTPSRGSCGGRSAPLLGSGPREALADASRRTPTFEASGDRWEGLPGSRTEPDTS